MIKLIVIFLLIIISFDLFTKPNIDNDENLNNERKFSILGLASSGEEQVVGDVY